MSDDDDALVYARVVELFRLELNVFGRLYLHPYLAVARDEEGTPRLELTTFEYESSAALDLLSQRDSTLVLCRADAKGMCAEDYVVMSQIARLGERDAVVMVRSMRGRGVARVLMVKLRFVQGAWNVSGSELINGPG
jgi:hypothetical protein